MESNLVAAEMGCVVISGEGVEFEPVVRQITAHAVEDLFGQRGGVEIRPESAGFLQRI
jgi:hypothetical protein